MSSMVGSWDDMRRLKWPSNVSGTYDAALVAVQTNDQMGLHPVPGVGWRELRHPGYPALDPPGPARFLVHECVPGPWAGAVRICQICNMAPGEIERLPLLENLLA